MKICKKRCQYCHRWFKTDKRKMNIQMTCMRGKCQKKRQAETSFEWRANPKNRVSYQDRQTEIVKWAREEDYWRGRRSRDPAYRKREAQRMSNKRKSAQTVAKRISITEIPLEERVRSLGLEVVSVAKRISIQPFFIGEQWGETGVQHHFCTPCVAKQISILWGKGSPIMPA